MGIYCFMVYQDIQIILGDMFTYLCVCDIVNEGIFFKTLVQKFYCGDQIYIVPKYCDLSGMYSCRLTERSDF